MHSIMTFASSPAFLPMTESAPVIVWFRQDLRLRDNPALDAAARLGRPILPVFVLDDEHPGDWRMGAASRWWLHHSLRSLDASLKGRLVLLRGDAQVMLPELLQEVDANAVYWNRLYEPWAIARDTVIKKQLLDASVEVKSFNGSLLFDPPNTNKADGTPYRVFTPFYRKGCLQNGIQPRRPLDRPSKLRLYETPTGLSVDELGLLPTVNWYDEIGATWTPGEEGAKARLDAFLANGIGDYKDCLLYTSDAADDSALV